MEWEVVKPEGSEESFRKVYDGDNYDLYLNSIAKENGVTYVSHINVGLHFTEQGPIMSQIFNTLPIPAKSMWGNIDRNYITDLILWHKKELDKVTSYSVGYLASIIFNDIKDYVDEKICRDFALSLEYLDEDAYVLGFEHANKKLDPNPNLAIADLPEKEDWPKFNLVDGKLVPEYDAKEFLIRDPFEVPFPGQDDYQTKEPITVKRKKNQKPIKHIEWDPESN
jgi:hypothetical protein